MKLITDAVVLTLLTFLALPALAGTRYVRPNNPAPVPPYTTWATAATNIQAVFRPGGGG